MRDQRKKTRDAITTATMQLLCNTDYENVTIRAIAKKARVTPSNIYKYFENKDELVAALYNDLTEDMINGLNSCIEGISDTRSKLQRVTGFYMEYFQNNPTVAMMMYGRNILRNWIESSVSYDRARKFGFIVCKIFEDGKSQGDIRKDVNVRLMNWIYHGGIRQMVLSWLYHNNSFRLIDLSSDYAEAIWDAVRISDSQLQFSCPYLRDQAAKQNCIADREKGPGNDE
jgi:AcrR family transcriptional regulator